MALARLALAALVTAGLLTPALAQEDNLTGPVPTEGALASVVKILQAGNNYFSARYQCSDPTGTSTSISAAVADSGSAGDAWRVTIYKGNKFRLIKSTANVSQFVAGATPFAPGVFSPDATLVVPVKKVQVVVALANTAPGGFPAGGTLRITTNGGGPECDRVQETDGIAEP
jgi:hypothetical protein